MIRMIHILCVMIKIIIGHFARISAVNKKWTVDGRVIRNGSFVRHIAIMFIYIYIYIQHG